VESEVVKSEKAQPSTIGCSTCKYEIGTDCQHPDHEKPGFFDLPESSCWKKKIFVKNPD